MNNESEKPINYSDFTKLFIRNKKIILDKEVFPYFLKYIHKTDSGTTIKNDYGSEFFYKYSLLVIKSLKDLGYKIEILTQKAVNLIRNRVTGNCMKKNSKKHLSFQKL